MAQHLGEIISLLVAISWTVTALAADVASHRLGALNLNVIRMGLSLALLALFLWIFTGAPYPQFASARTWLWLALSGLVGYLFGDWCLFNSYEIFGSKYGQLFMTISPMIAGLSAWLFLGETLTWRSLLAMAVTLGGIALAILARSDDGRRLRIRLPLKGILFGLGAGLGQGLGLVLSKIGLAEYSSSFASAASSDIYNGLLPFETAMPFAGTFIRATFGLLGFIVIVSCKHRFSSVAGSLHDRKGIKFALITTFFGPFLGVSLSLAAVSHAPAGIASTLMALTPMLIIVPYAIINHQRISLREVIATAITLTGVALFFLL